MKVMHPCPMCKKNFQKGFILPLPIGFVVCPMCKGTGLIEEKQ